MAAYGVNVINQPIVAEGKVIASYCPQTAVGVVFQLLEMLIGPEKMYEVKYTMGVIHNVISDRKKVNS